MCGRYFIDEANLSQEFFHILDVLKRKNTPRIILLSVDGIIKILLFILCNIEKNTSPVRIAKIEKYFMFLKLNSIYFFFFNLITSSNIN